MTSPRKRAVSNPSATVRPMAKRYVHTCVRVLDEEKSVAFYEALGYERRGKLQFETAYNVYMGLPGDSDTLELTVNIGRTEPYDLGDGYNHIALTVDDLDALLAELAADRRRAREAAVRPRRPARGRADLLRRRTPTATASS